MLSAQRSQNFQNNQIQVYDNITWRILEANILLSQFNIILIWAGWECFLQYFTVPLFFFVSQKLWGFQTAPLSLPMFSFCWASCIVRLIGAQAMDRFRFADAVFLRLQYFCLRYNIFGLLKNIFACYKIFLREYIHPCCNSLALPQCFPTLIGGSGWTLIKFEEPLFFTNSISIHICISGPNPHIASKTMWYFQHISHIVCNIASAAYQHSPHLIFPHTHISGWVFQKYFFLVFLSYGGVMVCWKFDMLPGSWEGSPYFLSISIPSPLRPILEPRFTRGIQPRSLPQDKWGGRRGMWVYVDGRV